MTRQEENVRSLIKSKLYEYRQRITFVSNLADDKYVCPDILMNEYKHLVKQIAKDN